MSISQEQQALVDKLRAKEPGMIQQAIDSLMGAGVTGGASKVVARAFTKFGQTAPSVAEADRIAAELAKAANKTSNKPLAKGLEGLKQSMQDTATRASKAKRVPPPTGQAAPLASTLEQLGVQAHVAAHLVKKPLAAAGTVAVGAGVAGVLPEVATKSTDTPMPVPTSLNPEKRKHEALQAVTTVHPADKAVLDHKPNQQAAKKAAELNGLPDPTPYFSGKLEDLSPKDYVAVVEDSKPGQTIYTLTESGRKKMGIKKGKGVHLSIPDGNVNQPMDTASNLFFNLPNDKVSMDTPTATTPESLAITKADTPEQALQKASTLKDSVYRDSLQKRQQESTTLQDLRALQDRARQYAARGDINAKKDLPKFDAQIAQEMDSIELRAQRDANNNLDVINAMNAAKFSLANAAKQASNTDKIAGELTRLTGLPNEYAYMLAAAPIAKAQVTKWLLDRQTQGEPKLISPSSLNDVYSSLTDNALKKVAAQNKEDLGLVTAELGLVNKARTEATAAFLQTGKDLSKGAGVDTTSLMSDFKTRAKSGVLTQLIAYAKGADFTDSPAKDIERMLKAGMSKEEIKNALMQNLGAAHLDTVAANIGLTEPEIRLAAQAEIDKYFPPEGMFTNIHQDIRTLLQGAI